MKCKVRFNEDLYLATGEKKLQIHFDQNLYCVEPKIYTELEAILKNIVEDQDFPAREESKITRILELYYHRGVLFMSEPIFTNMYIILKASHMFYKLGDTK